MACCTDCTRNTNTTLCIFILCEAMRTQSEQTVNQKTFNNSFTVLYKAFNLRSHFIIKMKHFITLSCGCLLLLFISIFILPSLYLNRFCFLNPIVISLKKIELGRELKTRTPIVKIGFHIKKDNV